MCTGKTTKPCTQHMVVLAVHQVQDLNCLPTGATHLLPPTARTASALAFLLHLPVPTCVPPSYTPFVSKHQPSLCCGCWQWLAPPYWTTCNPGWPWCRSWTAGGSSGHGSSSSSGSSRLQSYECLSARSAGWLLGLWSCGIRTSFCCELDSCSAVCAGTILHILQSLYAQAVRGVAVCEWYTGPCQAAALLGVCRNTTCSNAGVAGPAEHCFVACGVLNTQPGA